MHNTLPRCFLNSDGCVNEDDIAYAADGSYTIAHCLTQSGVRGGDQRLEIQTFL